MVCWPPAHRDKVAEKAADSFVHLVSMLEITWETDSVGQLNFITKDRGYIELGRVAVESPNCIKGHAPII